MSTELQPNEFSPFFEALHHYAPFPWQRGLAEQVAESGWPSTLDIPTGAGKTAAIDIAVFHLALEAARGPERQAPVRILFIVDRRLIVDDAHRRAQYIAKRLADAKEGILRRVADRLRLLSENDEIPLAVGRLRGGVPKEPDWARTPAQPTVVVSTIDQAGSRLLFRGYGVSDAMKPVHAGLLGMDSLLLLDEAHLSHPFVETVRDIQLFRREPWTQDAAAAPFHVVKLSATPGTEDDEKPVEHGFGISEKDRAHPTLKPRLEASKRADLVSVDASANDRAFAEAFTTKALALAEMEGVGVIAVVVNRVRRARTVFEQLIAEGIASFPATEEESGEASRSIALLTGRTRDLDRDRLLKRLLPYIQATRTPQQHRGQLFIVATQCIEAGADLDFDAMVTEIAPLDCLRQRFGRLNRMGRPFDATAAVIAASDQIAKHAKADPIYVDAMRQTWSLLGERSTSEGKGKTAKRVIDFGINRCTAWLPQGDLLKNCLAPSKSAPVLLPSAIDLWGCTSPVPAIDPEVSLYLHGPESGRGDVEIIWRQDIGDSLDPDLVRDRLRVRPPSTLEAVAVPLFEARDWLRRKASGDVADVEAAPEDRERATAPAADRAFRWRGADDSETRWIGPEALRPGDVIVVPAMRGGCDQWGWAPRSTAPVSDLGREANQRQRGIDILPLTMAPEAERAATMRDDTDRKVAEAFAAELAREDGARWSSRVRVFRADNGTPLALHRRLLAAARKQSNEGDAITEDDDSLRGAHQRRIVLSHHSQGVESDARRFAEGAGLRSELVDDVALAAFLHDAGKAHPEFKRFLYAGDELAAVAGPDLAKSAKLPESRAAWEEARRRSGLPRGARHEIASLRLADGHPSFARAHDAGLVLWLIGTHHGYGRPFFPALDRDWPRQNETFTTDLGNGLVTAKPALALADLTAAWLGLFERLKRRYGVWGLARLEAILRLADHRRSEAEQERAEAEQEDDAR